MLEENVDYTVEYIDNLDVGTAKAVFTGIGNYTGTYKATNFFKITKKTLQKIMKYSLKIFPTRDIWAVCL